MQYKFSLSQALGNIYYVSTTDAIAVYRDFS